MYMYVCIYIYIYICIDVRATTAHVKVPLASALLQVYVVSTCGMMPVTSHTTYGFIKAI